MSFDTVMKYFREISAIPRGSGNTEKISVTVNALPKNAAWIISATRQAMSL